MLVFLGSECGGTMNAKLNLVVVFVTNQISTIRVQPIGPSRLLSPTTSCYGAILAVVPSLASLIVAKE